MSRRKNEDRSGHSISAPTPPINALEENNDSNALFSFVSPTEIVDLPSRGNFYPEGHPLAGRETVEIKYMTAKEEDILTSKTLVNRGIVLERLLSSILLDKSVNVDDLLIGDKNAILVAARITGYGSTYETSVECPDCTAKFLHSFELSELELQSEVALEEHNVEFVNGLFFFDLPTSKVRVGIKPLTGIEEKELTKVAQKKKKYNLPEASLTDLMKTIIASANEVTEPGLISQFVDVMPARDSKMLRTLYNKIVPDVDMTQNVTCTECGSSAELEVPFTGEFFWPR